MVHDGGGQTGRGGQEPGAAGHPRTLQGQEGIGRVMLQNRFGV